MSIETEIIAALTVNQNGLRRRELFNLCDSAETDIEVSKVIKELKDSGVIKVAVDRKGNEGALYVLGQPVKNEGIVADFLKDKKSNAVMDAFAENSAFTDEQLKSIDAIDSLMEKAAEELDHFDVIMKSLVAIKKQVNPPARVIDDLKFKLECLNRLASLFNADIADVIQAIAVDLEA